MKVQEVKPEGRRLIGELSLRAAHNVHKVDVCAYSLSSKTNCMIAVFAKCIPKKDGIIYNKSCILLRIKGGRFCHHEENQAALALCPLSLRRLLSRLPRNRQCSDLSARVLRLHAEDAGSSPPHLSA